MHINNLLVFNYPPSKGLLELLEKFKISYYKRLVLKSIIHTVVGCNFPTNKLLHIFQNSYSLGQLWAVNL